jgi:hypothetical protein
MPINFKRFGWLFVAAGVGVGILALWVAFRPSLERTDLESRPGVLPPTQSDRLLFSNWLAHVRSARLDEMIYFDPSTAPYFTPELNKAAENARQIYDQGPNLIPFVVASLRQETDPELLRMLHVWLRTTAGIELFSRQDKPPSEVYREWDQRDRHLPSLRDNFIAEWDRGDYDAPERRLANLLEKYRSVEPAQVHRRELWPGKYYGVFGIPVLIEEIGEHNSFYAYATFLWSIGERTVPVLDVDQVSSLETKVAVIQEWWSGNHQKFTRLPALYQKIDAAVKALPDYPEERVTEN